jgi:hypothetical protein
LPKDIVINVNGNGWDLFRKFLGIRVPALVIPLERPVDSRRIPGNSLTSVLAPQISGLHINFVVHDTLRLRIENRTSKKFKLRPNVSALSFREGKGRISPIVLLPDSVELNGPESLVLKLADTLDLYLLGERIDNNFQEQVEVDLPGQEFVKRDPPVIDVRFEVGDILTLMRPIPLVTDEFPWGVVAGRDSVNVTFRVPAKYLEQFELAPLRGHINVAELPKGETVTYLPDVTGIPPYISVLSVDSVRVKRY